MIDEIAVGRRGKTDPDPEQPVEGAVQVATAVPGTTSAAAGGFGA